MAAALFAAGVAAALARLAPRLAPLWPDFPVSSLALPSLGALLAGVRAIIAVAGALFVLTILGRATAGWHRRRWLVALVLIALSAAAGLTAPDQVAAIARGVANGVAIAAVVLAVLRYDAASVPAFVATTLALTFAEQAARGGWPGAPVHAIIVALAAALIAWLATRYIERVRAAAASAAT